MRSFSAISSLLFILAALLHHASGILTACGGGGGGGAAVSTTTMTVSISASTSVITVSASTVTVTSVPAASTITFSASTVTLTNTVSASTITVTDTISASTFTVSASTITVPGSPASASTLTVTAGAVSASTVTITASASTITVTGSPVSASAVTVTTGAACSSTISSNVCSCPTSSSFPSPTSSSSVVTSSAAIPSTSSSLVSTPSGYSYLGCYKEPTNSRALPAILYADDELTVEKCSNYCAGYSHFGVEYSRECWCGNAIDPASSSVQSSQCDMTCDGNQQETCGGPDRLNIYSLGASPTTLATIATSAATPATASASATTYPYLGCYSEATSTRALTDDHYINYKTMSIEVCGSYCEGYDYFGLEYGGECYCGNKFNDGSVPEPETDCDMTCDGEAGEICGGPSRLSVYYYADEKPSTDCSNIGLQYAAFAEDPEIINRDGIYGSFDPTIYKTTPIEVVGTTTSVSYRVDVFADEEVAIYGSTETLGSYYLVIDNRGYLFAQASGTYTFATQSVDDLFLLWIGPLAYSGWTRANANLEGNLDYQQVSYDVDLVAGQYYPLRFMWVNGDGPGNFEFSITAPDGTVILDADTVASPYLVQFSCDGTSAPAYPAWGSET